MKYEAVKCPSCGAQIQLDDSLETGFCTYCGCKILVHDAIQRMKIEVSGQVHMSGISTVENDLKLGRQCLMAKDWKRAFDNFFNAVSKQAESFDAWFGCLEALTQDFKWVDSGWVKFDGMDGLQSVYCNCIQNGDENEKETVKRRMTVLLAIIRQKESRDFQELFITYKHEKKIVRKALLFFVVSALVIGLFASMFDKVSAVWDAATILLAVTLMIVNLITLTKVFFKCKTMGMKEEELHDKTLIQYIEEIETLLK